MTHRPRAGAALAAAAATLLSLSPPARANPSMSDDFTHMMSWLSNEMVQGLSFNAGETFDPPNELRPWHMQPDVSLGMGFMPFNKKKFPTIGTQALADLNPSKTMPSLVTFPNLTLHMRLGLPGRFDVSLRGADMTIPKGYKLSPGTTGDGQSNTIGFGVRRSFFGAEDQPLLSIGGNFNHVKGYFNFLSKYHNLELTPGYVADFNNTGRIDWNVNSFGLNAVVSQTFGHWTPFGGLGYNYTTGSVASRLQLDSGAAGISPVIGEASDRPEANSARLIFGAQLDRAHFNCFVNGEVKAIGASSGRTFIISTGLVAPFRIGAGSLAAKASRDKDADHELAYEPPKPRKQPKAKKVEPWAKRADNEQAAARPEPTITDYRDLDHKKDDGPKQPELIFLR